MGLLQYIVSVKDRATNKLAEIANQFTKTTRSANQTTSSVAALADKFNALRTARDAATDKGAIARLNAEMRGVQTQMRQLEGMPPRSMLDKFKNLGASILPEVGLALVAAFSLSAITMLTQDVVRLTAEFEKYSAVLTNTFGSQTLANKAMFGLEDFAAKTPFQLNEITSSYVKLVNRGIVPTKNELTAFGDVASSQGKSLDQFVEAILDAQTGEMERLKEFGITANKQGDKIAMTFKGQKTVIGKSSEAMRQYLTSLGNVKGVSGAMAVQSDTLTGKMSNMQDAVDSLKRAIGAGLTPIIKVVVSGLTETATWMKANLDVIGPVAVLFGVLAASLTAYSVGLYLAKMAQNSMTKAIIAQNAALLLNPYTWVVIGVLALAAGLMVLYKRSEKFRGIIGAIGGAAQAAYSGFKAWISGVWAGLKQMASGVVQVLGVIFAPIIKYYTMIGGFYASIIAYAWSGIKTIGSSIGSFFGSIYSRLSLLANAISVIFKAVFGTMFSGLIDSVKSAFSWILDNVLKPMAAFGDKLLKKIGIDLKGLTEGFAKIKGGASAVGGSTGEYAEKIAEGAKSGFARGVKDFRTERAAKSQNAGGFLNEVASKFAPKGAASSDATGGKGGKSSEAVAGGGSKRTNVVINIGSLIGTSNLMVEEREVALKSEALTLEGLSRAISIAQSQF